MTLRDDLSPLPPVNDGRRPSRLALARHATGEEPLAGPLDEAWLGSLEASRAQVPAFDMAVLRAAAERVDEAPPARPARASGWSRWWLGLGALAPLAAALVFFLRGPDGAGLPPGGATVAEGGYVGEKGVTKYSGSGSGITAPEGRRDPMEAGAQEGAAPVVTADGEAVLNFVYLRDGETTHGRRNTVLREGDLLEFRTWSGKFERVILVTVEADGRVAPLDDQVGFGGRELRVGTRARLPGSFEVHPPVPAIVVGFFGDWTESAIRAILGEAYGAGGIDAVQDLANERPDLDSVRLTTQ